MLLTYTLQWMVSSGFNATSVGYEANKAFKSDSQRLAFSLRSSIAKRRSHLNAALCLLSLVIAKMQYDIQ